MEYFLLLFQNSSIELPSRPVLGRGPCLTPESYGVYKDIAGTIHIFVCLIKEDEHNVTLPQQQEFYRDRKPRIGFKLGSCSVENGWWVDDEEKLLNFLL